MRIPATATAMRNMSTMSQKPVSVTVSKYSRSQRVMRLLIVAVFALSWPSIAQAQGTIIPFSPQYFTDTSGNPCSGCKLYTYAAGTTTPLATYTTVTLTVGTENANPVVINSGGWPSTGYIYLSATSYKFLLTTSAGVTIWTRDNQTSVPTTAGNVDITGTAGEALSAGDTVYLSDGSGALTAGRWYKTDADTAYSSTTAVKIGIAPAAIASGSSGSVRTTGRMTGLSGLTAGSSYFVSATAGALTSTPPTNAICVGKADTTTSLILPCDHQSVAVGASPSLVGTNITSLSASAGGSMVLLKANSGTSTNAAAENVDTYAMASQLTAKDTLLIYLDMDSATQQTATPEIVNATDSNIGLPNLGSLAAGVGKYGVVRLRRAQNSTTAVNALFSAFSLAGADASAGEQASFTTAWTGAWTLALRHGGVTAGGTFRWSWAVYLVKGQ